MTQRTIGAVCITLAALTAWPAVAAQSQSPQPARMELSAACREPFGAQYRYGANADKPEKHDPDGFKGATWSFFWNANKPGEGLTVTQDSASAGGGSERRQAAVITDALPEMLTFIVPMDSAIWLYTIYPIAGILMASKHGTGYASESAVGGLFHAKCVVTLQ